MPERTDRKSGDIPLLSAVVITIILAVVVIFQVYRSSMSASTGAPKVNPVIIQQLIREGRLSDHPAEYYEEMPSR